MPSDASPKFTNLTSSRPFTSYINLTFYTGQCKNIFPGL